MQQECLEAIKGARWKQGSIVSVADTAKYFNGNGTTDILIMLSQTCSIHAPKKDSDPAVYFLKASLLGNKKASKSARFSHERETEIVTENGSLLGVTVAKPCPPLPREELAKFSPDKNLLLSNETTRDLVEWYCRYFRRLALPDDLHPRLSEPIKKLQDYLDKSEIEAMVEAVYLKIHPNDPFGTSDVYQIELNLIVQEEAHTAYFMADEQQAPKEKDLANHLQQMEGDLSQIFQVQGVSGYNGKAIPVNFRPVTTFSLHEERTLIPVTKVDYISQGGS